MVRKAALILALISAPASAAWQKLDLEKPDSCGYAASFDGSGETTVMMLQSPILFERGVTSFVVTNENWSLTPETAITDEITIKSENFTIAGEARPSDHGFSLIISDKALSEFAASNPQTVSIMKGKTEISRLDFSDFRLAHAMFLGCSAPKIREREKRKRLEALDKELPRDPFAPK